MIDLEENQLEFSFPEVHPDAQLSISFQRTLRIPDDGKTYPLPPGLGKFPLRHLEDFGHRLPDSWLERGGVIMPMYQKEALWIYFSAHRDYARDSAYPFAVKVYTGKINAVTGREFKNGLDERKQDFLVVPGQPWLDGYCIEEGVIRQFVAMPLGKGYTAEEQITHEAEWGGMQIVVYPMAAAEYEQRFPRRPRQGRAREFEGKMMFNMCKSGPLGLAPGGKMKQEIYQDKFGINAWDLRQRSRCFVHLLNSQDWQAVTGEKAPSTPVDELAYTMAGLPWFDYYDENLAALQGANKLRSLKSISEMDHKRVREPGDHEDVQYRRVIKLGPNKRVHEGNFWDENV